MHHTTDLDLCATKQATTAIGRSRAAMAVTESGGYQVEKKGFLLDAPVFPCELFSTSIEMVVKKFKEAKSHTVAFKSFIPLRSRSEPKQKRGPDPSRSKDQTQAQKTSVTTGGDDDSLHVAPSVSSKKWCKTSLRN